MGNYSPKDKQPQSSSTILKNGVRCNQVDEKEEDKKSMKALTNLFLSNRHKLFLKFDIFICEVGLFIKMVGVHILKRNQFARTLPVRIK